VVVTFGGEVIADSTNTVCLREGSYPPVYYVPREDVRMDRLVRTTHATTCPLKGQASYYTLTGAAKAENAVWSYEAPFDDVADIRGHLAFYPNRVDAIRVTPVAPS
jgi:uncharacterized protein (DUF427 family)